MPTPAPPAPQRKRRNSYHHGHLRQALIDQAVHTIRSRGVEALTLRDVGAGLRVSRTALYRHFADKHALLAAVATEGFRTFRTALAAAWDGAGHGRAGFLAQGHAYIRFALENPSHYRVMFGGYVTQEDGQSELGLAGEGAFRVLVDALVELQQQGLVRPGDPLQLALFVWASVHGAALLASGGQLTRPGASLEATTRFTVERVWDGVAAASQTGGAGARPRSAASGSRLVTPRQPLPRAHGHRQAPHVPTTAQVGGCGGGIDRLERELVIARGQREGANAVDASARDGGEGL